MSSDDERAGHQHQDSADLTVEGQYSGLNLAAEPAAEVVAERPADRGVDGEGRGH